MQNNKIIENIFNKKFNKLESNILDEKTSITNKISSNNPSIYKYTIHFNDNTQKTFVGKWKSKKIIFNGILLISNKNIKLATLLTKNHKIFGYNHSYIREIKFYKNVKNSLKNYLIHIDGCYCNNILDKYFIAMDNIANHQPIAPKDYKKILEIITEFHKTYYNQYSSIKKLSLNHYTESDYKKCKKAMLTLFNELDNNKYFDNNKILKINNFINNIDKEYRQVLFHQTLTHNDFSPRNIFLDKEQIYIYDWELACYQNPEHDLIEFLVFVLDKLDDNEVKDLISYFKSLLLEKINVQINQNTYKKIIEFNVLEYVVNRLSLLRMANHKLNLKFIDQMTININRLMNILNI